MIESDADGLGEDRRAGPLAIWLPVLGLWGIYDGCNESWVAPGGSEFAKAAGFAWVNDREHASGGRYVLREVVDA